MLLTSAAAVQANMINRQDIRIRDPFILFDKPSGKYYMYGTGTFDHKAGFDVYETDDHTLRTWSRPQAAFRRPEGFWADRSYWAAEVHSYKSSYYMFATFESANRGRGVQILKSDSPKGPFTVHSPEPVTIPDYFALDGTLYVDKNDDPWMVYSREWVSIRNGEMRAVRLKPDLMGRLDGAEDILLFKASEAPWAAYWMDNGNQHWLTDGPHMLRTSKGDLLMVWSSNIVIPGPIHWGYAVGIARSESGEVTGPWIQEKTPLYNGHAGHGMIFEHPQNGFMLSLHQPNNGRAPVPVFLPVYEAKGKLTLADPKLPGYVLAYWRFEDGTPGLDFLPSIDILDCSGKHNHLRGADFETVGRCSTQTPTEFIPYISRANYLSYDSSEVSKSGARYLSSTGNLNKTRLTAWTVEASIYVKRPGGTQTFISKEKGLSFSVDPNGRIIIKFCKQDGECVTVESDTTIAAERWYNIVVTSDSHVLKLFMDTMDDKGFVMENSSVLSGDNNFLPPDTGAWIVGCEMSEGKTSSQFIGLIDEIRISRGALHPRQFVFARR